MKANCEFKTTAAFLLKSIRHLLPARSAKDAVLSISPGRGGIRLIAMSPSVNGAIDLTLTGRWDRTISVSLPRLVHILRSYGQSNINVLFLDGRLFVNRTAIDAIASDPPRRKSMPVRTAGKQLELPMATRKSDLFYGLETVYRSQTSKSQ